MKKILSNRKDVIYSWLTFFIKFVGFGIMLPMIFVNYQVSEVNLWLLILSLTSIIGLVDLGIAPNFVRLISYFNLKEGNFELIEYNKFDNKFSTTKNNINKEYTFTSENVIYLLNLFYNIISYIILLLVLLIYFTYYFYSELEIVRSANGFFSFLGLLLGGFFMIRSGKYSVFLTSSQKIENLKKIELFISLTILFITVTTYFLFKPPLYIILLISNVQFVLSYFVLRKFINSNKLNYKCVKANSNKILGKAIISSSILTSIGVISSQVLLLGTGVYLSFFTTPEYSASINFSIRIFVIISAFSNFIFYNRLPELAILYINNRFNELLTSASTLMFFTILIFCLSFSSIFLLGNQILRLINSKILLVSNFELILLFLVFIFERLGAMNIQLYSLSNKIKIHISNGVNFIIILLIIILLHYFKVHSFYILSLLFGNGLFYFPYSSYLMYKMYTKTYIYYQLKVYYITIMFILINIVIYKYV